MEERSSLAVDKGSRWSGSWRDSGNSEDCNYGVCLVFAEGGDLGSFLGTTLVVSVPAKRMERGLRKEGGGD